MRSIESVLKAGEVSVGIRAVLQQPQAPVAATAVPPNIGPRSMRLVETVEPAGHFALMSNGSLTYIRDGVAIDDFNAIDESGMRDEVAKGFPLVVYGLGAGQLATKIRELSEQCRGGNAAPVLVYEPDPVTVATFMRLGLPMQGISIACDVEDYREMFSCFLSGRTSVSIFHNVFTVNKYGVDAFESFMDTTRRIADAEQVTMNTINVRMPEWVKNVSQNVELIAGTKPLMALTGELQGVPAFIVGAGPSIERNGHLLAECARKGLVITIDVAGRLLVKYGAEPHLFVAVEGADLSEHLVGVDWIDHVPRAFSLEASPAVFRTGRGPLLPWADSNYAFNDVNQCLLSVEGLPIGGSVTTAAFLMAEAFGCSPIVLIGQDLANTGGKRAADGVLVDRLARLTTHGTVRKWGQDESYTNPRSRCRYWDFLPDSPQWLHARVWFEQRASLLKQRGSKVQLMNCSEGGSHILGFHDMYLRDVLAQLTDRQIDIMSKFDNVQPIWPQGIAWWRERQLKTIEPIAKAARDVGDVCHATAKLLKAGGNHDEISELAQQRQALDMAFRTHAQGQAMFIGSVQMQLRAMTNLRDEAVRATSNGEPAHDFLEREGNIFYELSEKAAELYAVLNNGC